TASSRPFSAVSARRSTSCATRRAAASRRHSMRSPRRPASASVSKRRAFRSARRWAAPARTPARTRGGPPSTLHEIATQAGVGIRLEEARLPIGEEVRGACEILGLDPLYVANEGKCLAIVAREAADEALALLKAHPLGRSAAAIGEVLAEPRGTVLLKNRIGGQRIVDLLTGEQLPRIC